MRLVPGGFWVEASGLFRVCPYTLGVDQERLFRNEKNTSASSPGEKQLQLLSAPVNPVAILRSLQGDLEAQEHNLVGLLRRVRQQQAEVRDRIASAIEDLERV